MSNAEVRYFVGAFVRFLHEQIAERQPTDPDDTVESLEVAVQCLETAFQLPGKAVKKTAGESHEEWDDAHPLASVDAFQLFRHSYDAGDISEERKIEAELLKNDGNGLMKDEKYVEALRAYSRALVIDPTNPVIYCNRAAAHSRLGDFQQAADDCKLALRYDPGYSKAYGRMGNAYSNLRRPELALDAYRNALRLDPSNPDYQHNLAVTEERLTESTSSTSLASNPTGLPAELLNISGLALNSPELMGFAQRVLADPMVHDIISNIRQDGGMESLLEVGRQMVQHMSTENPDLLQDLMGQQAARLAGNDASNTDSPTAPPEPPGPRAP